MLLLSKMYRIVFLIISLSVFLPIYKCQDLLDGKNEAIAKSEDGDKMQPESEDNQELVDVNNKGFAKSMPGDKMLPEADDKDKDKKDKKEIIFEDIKSEGGAFIPAFIHRNNKEYDKYNNGTSVGKLIEKQDFYKDLVKSTRRLHDIIIFQEQCLSDKEFEDLKNFTEKITKKSKTRIIVVKSEELKDNNSPIEVLQNITLGVDFSKNKLTQARYRNQIVIYPYVTLKRNELQLNSNKSRGIMVTEIDGFVERYEESYNEAFKPLLYHYTWVNFHMHTWPENLTAEFRKNHQRKHFGIVFEYFINKHNKEAGKQFIIYTSNSTYCHAGQMRKPTEIWKMEDKRWGATTIWCRTHHILLQIADLHVMYPNEILVKPNGPRYCETTVYKKHMVVVLRIEQYTRDVDLYFDIKLPSREDGYRTYTVERCYLEGRKSEGQEFDRKLKLGNTFYNRHNRIVLRKACPRNGALVLGTVGLQYLPHDDDKMIQETFSNPTARRIVFLVEGGLQDYCRVKKLFDWMAFAKKITVMMIFIALPLFLFLLLLLLLIRFRFYFYKCCMCIKAVGLELWMRSRPTALKMKEMAMDSPQTLSNTVKNVKSSNVTYGCYKCLMLLHPKNIAKCCKASGRGMKRLCTPVGHLIGIGAYLLQRFVYNLCVKIGGAPRGAGPSFTARLSRAREYTAQHIGNVAIYFIQGIVTISVVRAVTLVAATLLEIS